MKSKLDPDFFIRPDIEKQPHEVRFAAIWLMAQRCVNMVGYGQITENRFVYETALPKEVLHRAIGGLPKIFVAVGEGYWCKTFIRDQFGPANTLMSNNMCYALVKQMNDCPEEVIQMILVEYPELEELWENRVLPQLGGSTKSKSKSKSKSKNSVVGSAREPAESEAAKAAARPKDVADVKTYAEEIGMNVVAAESFFDHFEGNGWRQASGLTIKSWKAACRNWLRREQGFGKNKSLTKGQQGNTERPFDSGIPYAHTGGVPVAN